MNRHLVGRPAFALLWGSGEERPGAGGEPGQLLYRMLIDLDAPHLEMDGRRHALAAGMQVAAEVALGDRSVLEYLLSPIQRAFHEAGRER